MWTCECGEQIEDQFDTCWKCAGTAANVAAGVPLPTTCSRCRASLTYRGRKRFYEGGLLREIFLGELFVHREKYHVYVCSRCGYLELFLEGVGEEFRSKEVIQNSSPGDERSLAPDS